MSEISVVNIAGKSVDTYKSDIIVLKMNRHVVFEAVNSELQNKRQGTHKSKNKSEVSGTGKKPYKQKHTGRARQGSRRNPQFRGGGVAFGPTPLKNYLVKVNKKVFRIAWFCCWYKVLNSNKILILDDSFKVTKTKHFSDFLKTMGISDKKRILLIIPSENDPLFLFSRNIANIHIRTDKNCSVRDLITQEFVLISRKSLESIDSKIESWK